MKSSNEPLVASSIVPPRYKVIHFPQEKKGKKIKKTFTFSMCKMCLLNSMVGEFPMNIIF